MNILVLQETDWFLKGPNTQHHIFERLSKNPKINVMVIDYDINKKMCSDSLFVKRKIYTNTSRSIKNSSVKIIRTAHLQLPYFRRVSSLITNFFEILKIIRKKRPDVIIGFSITNGLIGLLLAKLFRIPYIYYYIDVLHELVPIKYMRKLARYISRISLKLADLIIVVTKLLEIFVLNEGISPDKVKIILNGISLENTQVDVKKLEFLKKKLSINENDFVFLFMGHLYEFAGLKEIIEYYNDELKAGKYKFKFLIIGDGGIYNSLINYVKKIDADWVILTGRLPFFELTEYFALADLCLMSFKLNEVTKDITPVKIMEYMAMGKPVLSNKLPSVLNEIGYNNGVIYAENQKDLLEKIGTLIIQKELLKDIGQKGYDLISRKYIWSKLIIDLKRVILELIKENIYHID
jgi:glycosyltransferase involved in cell wall biosynthesis